MINYYSTIWLSVSTRKQMISYENTAACAVRCEVMTRCFLNLVTQTYKY